MIPIRGRRPLTCHHASVVPLDALRLSDDVAFIEIPKARRLRCSRCGARDIHVMPDWADPIKTHRARMGYDPERGSGVSDTRSKLDMVPRE